VNWAFAARDSRLLDKRVTVAGISRPMDSRGRMEVPATFLRHRGKMQRMAGKKMAMVARAI